MKKIAVILCTFIVGMILFSVFREKERIRYGEDVNLVQAEFSAINEIESCHYKTEIIGNPYFDFIGPTNYHFTAVVIISDDEMEMIANNYPGEKRHKLNDEEEINLTIEQDLIDDTGIENTPVWTFNQQFRSKVLGGRYVGEVYYLEKENAVYISVENL